MAAAVRRSLTRADVLPTVRRYLLQCEPADDEHARLLLTLAADIDWLIVAVQEMASTEPRGWLKRIGCADPLGALALLRTEGPQVSDNEPSVAQVGDKVNPDTQTAGDVDKPRVWHLYGDANMRLDASVYAAACPLGYAFCSPGCGNYDEGECGARKA